MDLPLLEALNGERAARRASVLVTELGSGRQRLVLPAQAAADPLAADVAEALRTGKSRLVEVGSVHRSGDGVVAFSVTDNVGATRVVYHGDLPDLFREGQGIVAQGSFRPDRTFEASQVLAKHDETYMPREVADRLKEKGEWRPEGDEAAPAVATVQQGA